ncbi:MAG: hypothetical protein AAGA72_14160 [Pseudomonadota bacterium]
MRRLFDAYMIIDWSAASKPVMGANSIWIGMRARNHRGAFVFTCENPATRLLARQRILDIASERIDRGDRLLIGFDFALGYPAGTAAAIGFDTTHCPPWRAMHTYLAHHVSETSTNANARFALAAEMNAMITKAAHPFWGAPKSGVTRTLAPKKGDFGIGSVLPEHRLSETWIRSTFTARPKSVWQLLGAGSVGSQALLGIPVVKYLQDQLDATKLWPFETGFKSLEPHDLDQVTCVIAEVYPSTVSVTPHAGEIFDCAQVRTLGEHFESLDSAGQLSSAFAPPDGLSEREIHRITTEEGWILAK